MFIKTLAKLKGSYQSLPEKKKYLELLTAALSIPIMFSVLIMNFDALRAKKAASQPSTPPSISQPVVQEKIIVVPVPATDSSKTATAPKPESSVSSTPQAPICIKEVGPVEITSPKEGEVLTSDPVTISVRQLKDGFCGISWSYKMDGKPWSAYSTDSVGLYNILPGGKKLEIRIRSIASSDEVTLERSFSYSPPITATDSAQTP